MCRILTLLMNCTSSSWPEFDLVEEHRPNFCLWWFPDTTELGRIEPGEEKMIILNEKNSIIPVIDGH